jgi:hypothetical protein
LQVPIFDGLSLETMVPFSDDPIVMLSAVTGVRPAQIDAEIGSGPDKLHHAAGHDRQTTSTTDVERQFGSS